VVEDARGRPDGGLGHEKSEGPDQDECESCSRSLGGVSAIAWLCV
jgi:hypothetical protein